MRRGSVHTVCAVLYASACIFGHRAAAQNTAVDSLPQQRFVRLGFERIVNTFSWDGSARYEFGGPSWRSSIADRSQRTLQRSDRDHVKDEHSFRLDVSVDAMRGIESFGRFSSYLFTDNRSPGLNDLSNYKAQGGLSWKPFSELTVAPFIGYGFENQQGVLDQGPSWGGSVLVRGLRFGDSFASGEVYASGEDFSPRTQQEYRLSGDLSSVFAESARNTGNIGVRRTHRDFYLPLSDSISVHPMESRTEFSIFLNDRLEYAISRGIMLAAAVDASQRSIGKRQAGTVQSTAPGFNTDIEEFRLNGSAALRLRFDGTSADMRLDVNERNEYHSLERPSEISDITYARQVRLEEQKNNTISQTQIAASISQRLGINDTLSLAASAVKLVYNTPSLSNHDDRDELFLLAAGRWSHRFSPWLLASLGIDAQLRHTVFVSGERSANNTWNRVLRLSPEVEYRIGSHFVSRNRGEVTANYTIYDFESLIPSLRSFSLRQVSFSDSSSLRLGITSALSFELFARSYEQGEFRWAAFTVRPLVRVDEYACVLALVHDTESGVVSAGFRVFRQIRYRYRGLELGEEARLIHYGPLFRAMIQLTNRTSIHADGWYQVMSALGTAAKATPNLSMRLVWNL
ncbi:MAG: hypothetical protein HY962_04600 [Ignavibacteriae bacterium]|nr:hypothetical protein [Ignavibacteriota bacterium]